MATGQGYGYYMQTVRTNRNVSSIPNQITGGMRLWSHLCWVKWFYLVLPRQNVYKILLWVGAHTYLYAMLLSHKFKCTVLPACVNCSFVASLPPGAKLLRAERRLHITKYTNRKHCKSYVTPAYEYTHWFWDPNLHIDLGLYLTQRFHTHLNTVLTQYIHLNGQ